MGFNQVFILPEKYRHLSSTHTHTHTQWQGLSWAGRVLYQQRHQAAHIHTPTPQSDDHAMMRNATICWVTAPVIQWQTHQHLKGRHVQYVNAKWWLHLCLPTPSQALIFLWYPWICDLCLCVCVCVCINLLSKGFVKLLFIITVMF